MRVYFTTFTIHEPSARTAPPDLLPGRSREKLLHLRKQTPQAPPRAKRTPSSARSLRLLLLLVMVWVMWVVVWVGGACIEGGHCDQPCSFYLEIGK